MGFYCSGLTSKSWIPTKTWRDCLVCEELFQTKSLVESPKIAANCEQLDLVFEFPRPCGTPIVLSTRLRRAIKIIQAEKLVAFAKQKMNRRAALVFRDSPGEQNEKFDPIGFDVSQLQTDKLHVGMGRLHCYRHDVFAAPRRRSNHV